MECGSVEQAPPMSPAAVFFPAATCSKKRQAPNRPLPNRWKICIARCGPTPANRPRERIKIDVLWRSYGIDIHKLSQTRLKVVGH